MRDPPRYAPVVNDPDFTRVFVMDYEDTVMTVHILDFTHASAEARFDESTVRLRIRLQADWTRLLRGAGFSTVALYGDWKDTPYDTQVSRRLIAVAS
jgi:hypothetical protein